MMRRMMKLTLRNNPLLMTACVVMVLMLSGCRVRRPSDIMSPKVMESILYDYHLAQAEVLNLPREKRFQRDAYIDWVYQKHHITKEEFEHSLVWYTRYPKEMATIYKNLSNRIADDYQYAADMVARAQKSSADVQSGDSVDLWYLDKLQVMNTSDYMKRIMFAVAVDTTFYRGDTLTLSFVPAFVRSEPGVPSSAYVSFSLLYTDSISTVDTIVRRNGPIDLTLVTDRNVKMNRVEGTVVYLDSTDNRNSVLLMSGMKLMRYH